MIKRYYVSNFQRAEQTVCAVLPRSVKIRSAKKKSQTDLLINKQPVEIKWVGEGTLARVKRLIAKPPNQRPDIVVARLLSPGARSVLSEAGISWVDETGAAEIDIGTIIVSRTGYQTRTPEKSLNWTPAIIAVAEALLCSTKPTVSATEQITGFSSGSCTHALQVLTQLDLLEASTGRGRHSGRRVTDLEKLLEAYAAAIDVQKTPLSLQVGVVWRDVVTRLREIGKKWNREKVYWAATGSAAASVLAPYLTRFSTAEIYVDTTTIVGLEAIAADAGLRPIEGGRLTLKTFPTSAVRQLIKDIDGLRVVSWPRVYADLRAVGVRGEEAAEHLREVLDAR